MFSLIWAWINGWVNNREAGDLRRHQVHYDVTVMVQIWSGSSIYVIVHISCYACILTPENELFLGDVCLPLIAVCRQLRCCYSFKAWWRHCSFKAWWHQYSFKAWWRHKALLTLCEKNQPVTGGFPSQRSVTRSFDGFFECAWTNGWTNRRDAGDLKRHSSHCDVTVMKPEWSSSGFFMI